jgi:hypothetical protein
VNYHVRQLAAAGLLERAGQQRKRNMVEQQYVASAGGYVLSPELLGDAAPPAPPSGDSNENASAAQLLAVCARAQSEVADVMASASAAGLRVRTMSLQSEVRFGTAEQRADFTRELARAVSRVIAEYTLPHKDNDATPAPGPFRVVVGCYPIPSGT